MSEDTPQQRLNGIWKNAKNAYKYLKIAVLIVMSTRKKCQNSRFC